MVKVYMKYHFDYTERFNNTTLLHLEWDSDTDDDFYTMRDYFRGVADKLTKNNILCSTYGNEENPNVCGYCANCGYPSKGDTLYKILKMDYREVERVEV